MPTFTEAQMRTALETVIATAAPKAVVFPWWALGHDQNEWPGMLKPATGLDAGKVHGYVITRTNTEGERKNPQCVTRLFAYDIWGFHFNETGTRVTNTDQTFSAELDAITSAFINAATLPEAVRQVEEELSFRIDLDIFGGELLHYATGRLVLRQL